MLNNNFFRLKEIVKNVESFDLGKNLIILNNEKKILLYEEDRFSKILFQLNTNCHFKSFNEKIVISDNSKEIENYVVSIVTGEIIVDLNDLESSFVNLEGDSKLKTIKLKNKNLTLYDFESLKTVTKIDGEYSTINFISNNVIYLNPRRSQLITKFDILLNTFIWQTSLESYGTIRKILGVCGENLWLTTSDKTEHSFSNKLLALSIETGTVLYVIDNDYTFDANWVQLLEKEEKIVSIKGSSNQSTYLYEYCGKTGTELRIQTIFSLENYGLSIICAKVVENRVYFTATDHTQIVANHVGVMDLETLEVVWFEKVSPGNLKLEPPQVGAGKIYVLGAEGTLHIYEREM